MKPTGLVNYEEQLRGNSFERLQNPPDLSDVSGIGIDGSFMHLDHINLSGKKLADSRWDGSFLLRSDFSNSCLFASSFVSTCLSHSNLRGADLSHSNFTDASLKGADLTGAKLNNAIGNGKEIKSLQIDLYKIVYTYDSLCIGCHMYPIQQWWDFTDDKIYYLYPVSSTVKKWKKYKKLLQGILDISPAIPTKPK